MKAISWQAFSPLCTRSRRRRHCASCGRKHRVAENSGAASRRRGAAQFCDALPKGSHRWRSNGRRSPCPRRASRPHAALSLRHAPRATAAITAATTIAPFIRISVGLDMRAKLRLTRYLLSNLARLASDLTRNRHVHASAELQGLTLFTTACAQSNSGYDSRDEDHILHGHGLLS
jgi:hypothetical protein